MADFEIAFLTIDEVELPADLNPLVDFEDEKTIRVLEMQEALEEAERVPLILSASCSVTG